MDVQRRTDPIDALLARLADRQHGVVARRQLVALGVGRGAIERRLARGLLIPLHRGVYAFGHRRLRIEGRWLAAVLAAGPRAVLSHRDAVALHGLRPPPESPRVCVTSAASPRRIDGVWLFGRRALVAEDATLVRAVPVTAPARTLVDLASSGRSRRANPRGSRCTRRAARRRDRRRRS